MTNETLLRSSTSQTSLSNILMKCCEQLIVRIDSYVRKEKFVRTQLALAEGEAGAGTDRAELDYWRNVVSRHKGNLRGLEALINLWEEVDRNPFPGESVRVLAVAFRLNPYLEISFQDGVTWRGKSAWRELFNEVGALPGDLQVQVSFPENVEAIDIEKVEQELAMLALQNNSEFVLLKEAVTAMPWKATSKSYKYVKSALEVKGWRWGSRRVEGEKCKVILAPERNRLTFGIYEK